MVLGCCYLLLVFLWNFSFSWFILIMLILRKKSTLKSSAQKLELKRSLVGSLFKLCLTTHPPSKMVVITISRNFNKWQKKGEKNKLIFFYEIYKCGHRNVLSKRQVWMSIFHNINFKKKKILDTGSWIFLNKKLILDYYFCLKSGPVFLFQIFIIAPLPLPRDIKLYH